MAREFFKNGLFDKPMMASRIRTSDMSLREKLLGYLIGPFGTAALMAVMGQLAELYYTEVFYMDQIFGVGTYLIMSWATRVAAILMGLAAAYVVEHTVSNALAWVVVFNILYTAVGTTLFGLRTNLLTLCTRNQKDRNQVNLLDKISSYLLVGTTVTLVVGSVLYYTMLHGYPAQNWILLVGLVSLVSIPLSCVSDDSTTDRKTRPPAPKDG